MNSTFDFTVTDVGSPPSISPRVTQVLQREWSPDFFVFELLGAVF